MENRGKSQHFWEMACLALSWWSEWMDTKDSTWPRWRAQPKCCGWGEVFTFLGTKPSHMFSSCLFLSLQLFDIPEIPYHFPIYREFLEIYIYIYPCFRCWNPPLSVHESCLPITPQSWDSHHPNRWLSPASLARESHGGIGFIMNITSWNLKNSDKWVYNI